MQTKVVPLTGDSPPEIPLLNAPLERVIAQVRFPTILSIQKPSAVAEFQEALRVDYPHLHRDSVKSIELGPELEPNFSEAVVWRFADQSKSALWRVSLGIDFVALETSAYDSRSNFLDRFANVLAGVEECFNPAETQRIGLRYIDRLTDGAVAKIAELIQPSVLGILQPNVETIEKLQQATVHSMTQAQFKVIEGAIQGRWGNLPPNTTYDADVLKPISKESWVLDLDMFSNKASRFKTQELFALTTAFAERVYSVFRLMITDGFMKFYGGTP